MLARRRAELVNTVMLADAGPRDWTSAAPSSWARARRAQVGATSPRSSPMPWKPSSAPCTSTGASRPPGSSSCDLYMDRINDVADEPFTTDHKSRLQELAAQRFGRAAGLRAERLGSRARQGVHRRGADRRDRARVPARAGPRRKPSRTPRRGPRPPATRHRLTTACPRPTLPPARRCPGAGRPARREPPTETEDA